MKILNSKEIKELHKKIQEAYGYSEPFTYVVFANSENKYFIAPRTVEEILDKRLHIERVGIYLGQEQPEEIRLSIEGSQLIGPKATHHVLELTPAQRDDWMLGKDIILDGEYEQAFHIVRCGEDYMGCGKYKNGTLLNYVPKERYVGAVFTDDDIITSQKK